MRWIGDFFQDLRFGLRMLRKSPGYSFTAIAALGLGIGANTALFTLFNAIVSRDLAVPEPNSVVRLLKQPGGGITYAEYEYYRNHSKAFDALSAWFPAAGLFMGAEEGAAASPALSGVSGWERLQSSTQPVMALFVSSNYFSMMRVAPAAGRAFQPDDDRIAAAPYPALLSENFWENRFGRDSSILGRRVMFRGIPAVIVGITPRDFTGTGFAVPDVWLPLALRDVDRPPPGWRIEGRIRPGVSLQQAEAELALITNALREDFPSADPAWKIRLDPARSQLDVGNNFYFIYGLLLQPTIAMVLLIACANVAGLLLGKAASRQKEIAVRLSMGASRGRLIRQLLTEGVLIAQIAGFLSLLITLWILKVVVHAAVPILQSYALDTGESLVIDVTPDLKVLLYALGISSVTGIVFALLPALQATRWNLAGTLKEEVAAFGVRGRSSIHDWVVATQIAVCLMLLIGAGTLVRSAVRLRTVTDPGFDRTRVLSVSILNPEGLGYSEGRIDALNRELASRLPALPGVMSIASASRLPLGGGAPQAIVAPRGSPITDPQAQIRAPRFPFTLVSAGYFETIGIPLLQGRALTPEEVSRRAPVTVISDALARKLWPGESAIGKTIAAQVFGQPSLFFPSVEIIGVVGNVNYSMTDADPGTFYFPTQDMAWNEHLFIRTDGDATTLVATLSTELRAIDRNLSGTIQTMDSVVENDTGFIVVRVFGIIFSVIGLIGLGLASVGIYSMVGYAVSQQTREVGIRMALGAQRTHVLRLVMGRSIRPIGAGIAAGVVLGISLSLVMSSQSPGLQFLESWVLAAISLLLTMIALTAAYIPTRKAMKLDPSVALRSQ